ncbi:pyridoxamine 5'-phosphate oxidase family protein [Thermobifida halotolerans]|uniref:Pyridoxamine 5'-phosphate oxidase family protein n=1 Tax=Thermobifida halotolerans TaxID=483545 RepID=A0A399G4F8_9ACTN|nr:pyridoxamine 5'-phosphate oxidase family protein [Thermobifida halotolerans]UOE18556.1 pyridoxamine 5'-phosphate oxidase family protein [Thermobifida halotolerans]
MFSYHRGERAVQERAGLTARADHSARAVARTIPEVAARFLTDRPMLVVGAADGRGRVWCSALTGPPGFLRVPDERTLEVAAVPRADDPLAETLTGGETKVGTVAVDPATRRRMRLNGTARPVDGGLRITADQVYANCPKYIQRRTPEAPACGSAGEPRRSTGLDTRQRALLARADTFYVATSDDAGNADASHRGGDPGFLRPLAPDRLVWPDYVGNAMLMTLGNLAVNPGAGLLVPDWETGDLLHLTGTARLLWDVEVPQTRRAVEFTVAEVVETPGAGPVARGGVERSRHNPPVVPMSSAGIR